MNKFSESNILMLSNFDDLYDYETDRRIEELRKQGLTNAEIRQRLKQIFVNQKWLLIDIC